jgi:hypothetical protein
VVDAPLKSFPLNLFAPTVSAGGVTVRPQVLTLSLVLFTPTVGVITAPLLSKTLVLHIPGVFSGVNNTVVTVPLLTLTLTTFVPSRSIELPDVFFFPLVLFTPTVAAGAGINAPLKSFPLELYPPTVAIEIRVVVPLLTLTLTLHTPTVLAFETIILETPLLTKTLTLFAPSVALRASPSVPLLTLSLQLFIPTVIANPGLVTVESDIKTFNLVLFPPVAIIGRPTHAGDGVAVLSHSVGSIMLDGAINSKMITATHGSVMTQARAG